MNRFASLILVTTLFNIGYTQQKANKVNAEYFIFDKKGQKITPAFSFIDEFTKDGYAICAKGGNSVENPYGKIPDAKYGIVDKNGKILVPLTYDYIEEISDVDSLFIANLGESYGLIDYKGNKLTSFDYSELTTLYDMDMVLKAKRGNTYSIIDFNGKPLTKNYQELYTTTSGLIVQEKGYDGLLDNNFKEIFPCKYEEISELDPGIFHVTDKFLKHWLMDIDGKKLSAAYDDIQTSYNDDYETVGYTVSSRGKKGYMDKTGNILIQPTYSDLTQINLTGSSFLFSYSNEDGKYGLIDDHGKKLGKAVYSSINSYSYFGKYILVGVEKKSKSKKKKNKDGGLIDDEWYYDDYTPSTYGLIDAKGKLITKPVYEDYVYGYSDNKLIILKKGGNWVALDENLSNAFDKEFSNIEQFGDYFKVQIGGVDNGYGTPEGGVFGLIDLSGKEIIPIQYEDIQEIGYDSNNGYLVKKAGKYGICSTTGKMLFNPEYTEINCNGDLCIVSRFIEQYEQNKYGLFNHTTLKEIVPTQYDQIESLSYDGNYIYGLNNKFGLMDKNGKIILPSNYNYLKATDLYDNDEWILANAYGQVTKGYYGSEVTGGNWGVIDIHGDTILPFKFKEISFENDSIVNLWDYDDKAYLYNLVTNKPLTNSDANYIDKINYDWQHPIFLLGKNVIRGEYGDVSGGTYGLVTAEGKELCSFNYSEIKEAGDYFIANSIDFNGFDLLDEKGTVLKKRVTSIQALNDSLFLIQNEGKASVFNPNSNSDFLAGDYIDFATPEYLNGYGSINIGIKAKGDKWGILNRQGEMLIAPQYCDIIASSDLYVIAAKCGAEGEMFKYGVIDLMNNVLIPFEYESIESTYGGNFDCIKGKTVYSVNLSNEIISKNPVPNE